MKFKLDEQFTLNENLKSDKINLISTLIANGFTIQFGNIATNDNYVIAHSPKLDKDILILIDRTNNYHRLNTKHLKNNSDSANYKGETHLQNVSPGGTFIGGSFVGSHRNENRFVYDGLYSAYILDSKSISISDIIRRY